MMTLRSGNVSQHIHRSRDNGALETKPSVHELAGAEPVLAVEKKTSSRTETSCV